MCVLHKAQSILPHKAECLSQLHTSLGHQVRSQQRHTPRPTLTTMYQHTRTDTHTTKPTRTTRTTTSTCTATGRCRAEGVVAAARGAGGLAAGAAAAAAAACAAAYTALATCALGLGPGAAWWTEDTPYSLFYVTLYTVTCSYTITDIRTSRAGCGPCCSLRTGVCAGLAVVWVAVVFDVVGCAGSGLIRCLLGVKRGWVAECCVDEVTCSGEVGGLSHAHTHTHTLIPHAHAYKHPTPWHCLHSAVSVCTLM